MSCSLVGARIRMSFEPDGAQAVGKVIAYKNPMMIVQVEDGQVRNHGSARVDAFGNSERIQLTVAISGDMANRMVLRPLTPLLRIPTSAKMRVITKVFEANYSLHGEMVPISVLAGGSDGLFFESDFQLPFDPDGEIVIKHGEFILHLNGEVMTQTLGGSKYSGVFQFGARDRIQTARWNSIIG